MAEKLEKELENLKTGVLSMARLARGMLHDAMDAMVRQDTAAAAGVAAQKKEIRGQSVDLEEQAYRMIAMYQPTARDMRAIACALKVIASAERIGRYGKDIANVTKHIVSTPHLANMMSLPHMADLVVAMFDDTLLAYEKEDLRFIEGFSERDDAVDALRHSIFREGITYMMEDQRNISRCTYYIIVARYLERCADHACRVAENIFYMETGERIEIK
jgi:phosphate transport system protein